MDDAAAGSRSRPLWVWLLAAAAVLVLLLALVLVLFPWDWLRGPVNRYVSDKTGRHFEITRKLDVKLGRTTRILADGIEFANPDWASDSHLVKAESAEIEIELLPLLERRIVLPRIELRRPQLGLQMEPDGRRTWALGRETGNARDLPDIGALVVDQGSVHFIAASHGADIRTDFEVHAPLQLPAAAGSAATSASHAASSAASAAPATSATSSPGGARAAAAQSMPLSFKARGIWRKEPFTAQGRTGNVLFLSAPLRQPFPLEIEATAGATTLRARGSVASLATLDGADAVIQLQGRDLADLYQLVGVVLPATPRYSLQGQVSKQGDVWHVGQIKGKLGNSDLTGELSFDRARTVPLLVGNVQSRSLDFDDLAPLVGLPEQPRSAAALPDVAVARPASAPVPARGAPPAARDARRKVLPTASIDLGRLKAMEADVRYTAARISHVRELPLERVSVHVRLKGGELQLDPLNVGVAGGSLVGRVHIDGNSEPAAAEARLGVRALELNKLFPGVARMRASFGRIHGDIDLQGRGNSVAQMLGTSSGNLAFLMGRGQFSNLLLEIAGIDGAEIIKFMLGGDQDVTLLCAGAAFDVNKGVMTSRALVLDTDDTVIYGDGQVSLANESLDLTLHPYPKDMSFLSLRAPLKLAGTFADPSAGPDKAVLAGRAGLALALGAVNPLLALAATVETGPGQDANCGPALREAASPYAAARIAAMSQPPAPKKANVLGGPPAPAASPASAAPGAPAGAPVHVKKAEGDGGKRGAPAPDARQHAPDARQHAPVPAGQPYGP